MRSKRSAFMRNKEEEGFRMKILRHLFGFGKYGGRKALAAKFSMPLSTWSGYETGDSLIPVNDYVRLIESAGFPDLTCDWLFRGKVEGLPVRLRDDLDAAAAAAAEEIDDDK